MALVAVIGVAAAAFQIDPALRAEITTPTTGLWVPSAATGEILLVDAASETVTARVEVSEPGADLEVGEEDYGVVVVDRSAGRIALVDPALHEVVRSEQGFADPTALVDIGPQGVVAASGSEVILVSAETPGSVPASLDAQVRSVVAADRGFEVDTVENRTRLGPDGTVLDQSASRGVLVAVADRAVAAAPDGVHDLDGERLACFERELEPTDHVVGSDGEWVVAVVDRTVHIADLANGSCASVRLRNIADSPDDAGLGRPVVAAGRVFVPEGEGGVVHIVDPEEGRSQRVSVFRGADVRLRARGDIVAAFDREQQIVALVSANGQVDFVDTSVEGGGLTAELDEDADAVVLGANEVAPDDGADAGGIGTGRGAPVIDPSVIATVVDPTDEDPVVDDGELVANLSLSASTVAVDQAVRFSDASRGGPEAWSWDFGDGTSAQGQVVEKAWTTPGTYQVTLRVARGEETSEISVAITVLAEDDSLPLDADFVFSSLVVGVDEPVEFEDRSDGPITGWRWTFGDGTSSATPDATKSWDSPGIYTVQLTVTGEQGADSAQVEVTVLEDLQAPVAVLDASATSVGVGEPVTFTGSSSTDEATYRWSFGDGTTRTGPVVTHGFLAEGTFTVRLVAENGAGSSTASVAIVVGPPARPPVAAIGTLPVVIEVGDVVSITSLSTNGPESETWTFGDGRSATGTRVTHTWESPGTYSLELTATNRAGTDTETRMVEVLAELPAPVAQIGAHDESPWVGAATVFIDASANASAWSWDFGDGSPPSTAQNPLHTFTTPGSKTVTLTVTNRNGSDTVQVTVDPRLQPTAAFVASPMAIRAGQAVQFTDTSVNAASWSWDFGDTTTSTLRSPLHTYRTAGRFEVTLTVRSATGDEASFGPVVINVDPGPPVLAGIAIDRALPLNALTPVGFSAVAAASSGPIVAYEIDFGDGSAVQTGTSATFTHTFAASGTYTVTMRARGPLADDFSPPVTRAITVVDPPSPRVAIAATVPATAPVGPVALVGVAVPGSGPIAAWSWTVRRGIEAWSYTGQSAVHPFTEPGVYTIELTATSPIPGLAPGTASRSITITLPPPPTIQSLVAQPSTVIQGQPVSFTPTVTGVVTTWEWDYQGGGTGYVAGGPIGSHAFASAGVQRVYLRVTDRFGQSDARFVDVNVQPLLVADFTNAATATPQQIAFTDTSSGPAATAWAWDFGDGNESFAPNPTHTYAAPGPYEVTLVVTAGGQVQRATKTVVVS